MLKRITLAISMGGLLLLNPPSPSHDLPTATVLCDYFIATDGIRGYDHSSGPVAKVEQLSNMPSFNRAFPGRRFVPGSQIWSRQELTKSATAESGASKIQVYILIYSSLDHALVFDSPTVMNEGIQNSYGYRIGTFSGFPIGDASRFVPNPSDPNSDRVPAARIAARAGNIVSSAEFNGQPIRSGGRRSWSRLSTEDKQATELALRLALSNGVMASVGFRRIATTPVRLGGISTICKALPNRDEVVLLERLAKIKNDYGIIEFSINGKKLRTGIGAKQVVVGNRKFKLAVPVLCDRGQIWIDRQGLTKAIN